MEIEELTILSFAVFILFVIGMFVVFPNSIMMGLAAGMAACNLGKYLLISRAGGTTASLHLILAALWGMAIFFYV